MRYCAGTHDALAHPFILPLHCLSHSQSAFLSARRFRHDERGTAATSQRRARGPLEALGPVPFRAPVGHGSRGLQRERRRLGLFPARPRPFARLSLGRRRHRRHLRPPSAHLFRDRVMERKRFDSEGAAVWAHQSGRESRRGREGVLLLSRRHANQFLSEISLQISARCFPVFAARGGKQEALAART